MTETQDLLREINQRFLPSKVISKTVRPDKTLIKLIPFSKTKMQSIINPLFMHAGIKLVTNPKTSSPGIDLFLEEQN